MATYEHIAGCALCGWEESWTTENAAKASAVWHIFEQHHDRWVEIMGERIPTSPKPESVGQKFEQWERQT